MQYPFARYRAHWQRQVHLKLQQQFGSLEETTLATADTLQLTTPPEGNGEIAIPLFAIAKLYKTSPATLASQLATTFPNDTQWGRVEARGAYLNIHLPFHHFTHAVLNSVAQSARYGDIPLYPKMRIAVEFSSPNTNKPLHLGHLRNNALGASLANILEACGAEVRRVNLINDRGIHICKSMAAYMKFGKGATPSSTGRKSDHFVGDWYVRYNQWEKDEPNAIEEARSLLRRWEENDPHIRTLWRQMNDWAQKGMEQTYQTTGIYFDEYDYESDTYLRGREEILRHRESEILQQEPDGSHWIDLSDANLDRKVLLRADGTSLYVTQDIGTILARYARWRFDRHIYVVASEQRYHFQVLFEILKRLGYQWASSLVHRSYGMVYLPEGKMKSREGTVVDADDLLATLQDLVRKEITQRNTQREGEDIDIDQTAHKIAIAALHYWLLQVEVHKDVHFETQRSISFNGNSGAYILYVIARIESILREAERQGISRTPAVAEIDSRLLSHAQEWQLICCVADFPSALRRAAELLDPSQLTGYLYRLAKLFSQYYHTLPIVIKDARPQSEARIALCNAILTTLRRGSELLCMPVVTRM